MPIVKHVKVYVVYYKEDIIAVFSNVNNAENAVNQLSKLYNVYRYSSIVERNLNEFNIEDYKGILDANS